MFKTQEERTEIANLKAEIVELEKEIIKLNSEQAVFQECMDSTEARIEAKMLREFAEEGDDRMIFMKNLVKDHLKAVTDVVEHAVQENRTVIVSGGSVLDTGEE